MHELGLFDFADHLERLLQTGDLFEALDRYVDFEVLRPVPTGAPGYGVSPKGRRPPRDPVSMFEFPVPLDDAKRADPEALTKSGSMAGSGGTLDDIWEVVDGPRAVSVDFPTAGQYPQPAPIHHPIDRFRVREEFAQFGRIARGKDFPGVSAPPPTRSSFHADENFTALKLACPRASANRA